MLKYQLLTGDHQKSIHRAKIKRSSLGEKEEKRRQCSCALEVTLLDQEQHFPRDTMETKSMLSSFQATLPSRTEGRVEKYSVPPT